MTNYYLQIDYIDENGYANYIDTFDLKNKNDEETKKQAEKHLNILNNANFWLHRNTKFTLNLWIAKNDDESECIKENITNALTINERTNKLNKDSEEYTNYVGKIVTVYGTEDDEELDDFIEEHGGKIEVLITHQEEDYLYGNLTNGEDLPYHIEVRDIE